MVKKIRHFIEYMPVWVLYHTILYMPQCLLKRVGIVAGYAMSTVPSIKKLALSNVMVAFPEKSRSECKKIAYKSIQHIIISFLEFFWFTNKPEKLKKYVTLSQELLDMNEECKKTGQGFILITPHLGNWELGGLAMSYWGNVNFAVVAKNVKNPYLHDLVNSGRVIKGNRVISSKGAVKGMMKALKEGYAMATLIDQNTRVRDGGIFVDFFGLSVPTSRAPAIFGRKLNTPIAVGSCIYKNGKYDVSIDHLPKKANEYDSDQELIQDLMNLTEELIRKYPEQYLWFYQRFKYIPVDKSDNKELIERYPYYASVAKKRFYSKIS